MGTIVLGSVLFGAILGHIFKWQALLASCLLAIALVLAYPASGMESFLNRFLETVIVAISIQAGYFGGLFVSLVQPRTPSQQVQPLKGPRQSLAVWLYSRLSVNLDEGVTTLQHGMIAGGVAFSSFLTVLLVGLV